MRILVAAIRPSKKSVQPPGIHLRWTLPSKSEQTDPSLFAPLRQQLLGFPEKGFSISRRKHGVLKPTKLSIPRIEKGDTPQRIPSSNHAILFPDPTTRLISDEDQLTVLDGGQLLIRFLKPIVFCEIEFIGANGDNEIKAYRGRNHLTSNQTSVASGRLSVMGAYFDHVLVTLNFEHLKHITFVTEKDYCNAPDWVFVAQLHHLYPGQLEDALKRLEQGLQNRYTTSRQSAIEKYSPHVEELLIRLNSMLEANVDAPIEPENHKGDCPNGVQVSELSTRNLLLSIASDPNLAKIMGLYWVDQFDARKEPAFGEPYDYKVEGLYGGKPVCGLAINVGKEDAPFPSVPDLKTVEQLPGFRWNNRAPLARVGLNWTKTRSPDPTSTILYDVYRQIQDKGKFTRLTENTPVPAQPNGEPGNDQTSNLFPRFVDQDVPLGSYVYQISGIDIFGQESINSDPHAVEIIDKAPPPPPVHLRCSVVQPGYPWRDPELLAMQIEHNNLDINAAQIRMSLEYGHAQHRQAPDATHVTLYWRQDSLRINRIAKVIQVVRQQAGNGLFILKVKLDGMGDNELKVFDGGVLSIQSRNGQDLPNSQRTPTRIEKIESNQIVLRPSSIQLLEEDECELISDVHNRDNWRPFGDKIEIQKPMQGKVLEIRDLHVRAGGKHKITPKDAALAAGIANSLPGGLRPEDTAKLPPVTELLIDRDLLESDLFSDGLLIANDNKPIPIMYSTAGIAHSSQSKIRPSMISRIGIAPSDSVDFNKTIRLASPEKFDTYGDPVRFVLKEVIINVPPTKFELQSSGGEVVFEWEEEHCGQKEIAAVTARVVSSTRKQEGSKTSLLIKIRKSDWESYGKTGFLVDKSTASYYAPYLVQPFSASIARDGDSLSAPGWRWSSESGVLKGYIAATAIDDRSNEGPLSHPIEASAFKPPPTGSPNPPIPCELGDAQNNVNRWYASPPDFDGDATVCLKWNPHGIDPAEGLRCEIARALDATIIEADKKNWLLGLHEPGFSPVEIDILSVRDPSAADGDLPTDVVVVQFKPENNITDESLFVGGVFAQNEALFSLTEHKLTKTVAGNEVTFEASVKPPAGAILNTAEDAKFCRGGIVADEGTSFAIGTPEMSLHNGQVLLTIDKPGELDLSDPVVQTSLVGGRLSTASGSSTNYFKISKISPDRNAAHQLTDRVCLLLQPQIGNRTKIGAQVMICSAPNYDLVKPNDALLRELADKPRNISAFGVVSGTPINSANGEYLYRDEFPGIGSNRFFYKARGKDSSENNTRWSKTSMPFYQVDTSEIGAPYIVNAIGGDRMAKLYWRNEPKQDVTEYKIYRVESKLELNDLSLLQPKLISMNPADGEISARLAPLVKMSGNIDLNIHTAIPANIQVGSAVLPRFSGIFLIDENHETNESVNFLVEDINLIDNRKIRQVNPALSENTEVVVVLREEMGSVVVLRQIDDKILQIKAYEIDLSFPYAISEVLGVYRISEVDYFVSPLTNQSAQNYYTSNSQYNATTHQITQLDPELTEGEPVVIQVTADRAGASQSFFIISKPLFGQQLVVENSSVALDFDLDSSELIAIYKLEDYNDNLDPLQQTALNYLLAEPTEFNSEFQFLTKINPALKEGIEVAVNFLDDDGNEQTLKTVPGIQYYCDKNLAGLPKNKSYYYQIVSAKRVKTGNNSEDEVEILSAPSKLVSVNVFDRTPPEPPVWEKVEWIEVDNDLAVSLQWHTAINNMTCSVQRRTARTGGWLTVSPALSAPSNESWEFIDYSAQSKSDYEYRIRAVNALGNVNVDYNITPLFAVEESG